MLLDNVVITRRWLRTRTSRRYLVFTLAFAVSDSACALAGVLVAHVVLARLALATPSDLGSIMAMVPVAWVVSFHAFRLYDLRRLSGASDFRRMVGATCLAMSFIAISRVASNTPPYRKSLVLTGLTVLALHVGTRCLWRWLLRHLREKGFLAPRTVIVGTNHGAGRLGLSLCRRAMGFQVLGHVAAREGAHPACALPVLGHLNHLNQMIQALGLECVVIASTAVSRDDLVRLAQIARQTGVEVWAPADVASGLIPRWPMPRSRYSVLRRGSPCR